MVDVTTSIVIHRPKDTVAAYAADPANAPEWYANIKSVKLLTPPPIGVGSKMAFEAQFMGRQLAYIYEVVSYMPGSMLVMETADGPFPMQTTYTWGRVDANKTKMTLTNRGEPSGFSKLMAPLMALMMRRANRKDLKMIKGIIETRY